MSIDFYEWLCPSDGPYVERSIVHPTRLCLLTNRRFSKAISKLITTAAFIRRSSPPRPTLKHIPSIGICEVTAPGALLTEAPVGISPMPSSESESPCQCAWVKISGRVNPVQPRVNLLIGGKVESPIRKIRECSLDVESHH